MPKGTVNIKTCTICAEEKPQKYFRRTQSKAGTRISDECKDCVPPKLHNKEKKKCEQCHVFKRRVLDFLRENTICTECRKENAKEQKKIDSLAVEKQCKDCKKTKLLDEFPFCNTSKYGRKPYCRQCYPKQTPQRHGITLMKYSEMLEEQSHGCAICHKTAKDNRRALVIDHDHNHCPGKHGCPECLRGLLCDQCNRGLGFFGDNLGRLQKAVEYLSSQ